MTTYNASSFSNTNLNAKATNSSSIYIRDVSVPLNTTMADAGNLGTLTTDKTQLDVLGQLSRENATHFYKFNLDGTSLKLNFNNQTGTAGLRLQILDSSGKIIADNSSTATTALQTAFSTATSSKGLTQKAGDYYVKVTFDATSLRSAPQTYSVALYSGTKFNTTYQTKAKAQMTAKQYVLTDQTMTYSLIDAKGYDTKQTHVANETPATAVNIGWLSQDKSALSVTSQLTEVCAAQYYAFTLQKGDNIKLAYNNHTNTSDTRVQVYDPSGTRLWADSMGTEAQKAAYAKLSSSTGLAAKPGQYLVKLSYAPGAVKTKQIYDFKVYSGSSYSSLYTTTAGTESREAAMANGHIQNAYSMKDVTTSYLMSMSQDDEVNIMETLSKLL